MIPSKKRVYLPVITMAHKFLALSTDVSPVIHDNLLRSNKEKSCMYHEVSLLCLEIR